MGSGSDKRYTTESGIELKPRYNPDDVAGLDYERDLGEPGQAPFTRGPYPGMYRSRLWRIAQLMGSGKVEDTRDRVTYSHGVGGDWVVFEPDQITTVHMWDPDHPEVTARKDDVGLTGSPILGLPDYEILLEPLDLSQVYFHMGGSPWNNSNVYVVAEKRGVPLSQIHGTGQGEMFLPYLSTPFKDMPPPSCHLRNNCDVVEFNTQNVPHVVPISCAGHNARANGISAFEELAIVLAWNIDHIEYILKRGRQKIDDFAQALGGVNYSIGRDFFEEICKVRAARRMWYKLLKDRYKARDPKCFRLRIHGFSADRDYTREQPLVNIVRSTYRTMAAALGGVQSLGIGPYDEAITTPSEEALLMAIRTQQVIQHESGIDAVADPLAGSYYVESLTSELEERAWKYLEKIEDQGGLVKTIETGWLHAEATRGALEQERRLESGEKKLVGYNCFRSEEKVFEVRPHRAAKAWEEAMARLEKMRRERDDARVTKALDELRRVVENPEVNQFPAMMEAIRSLATVGEIGQVYRDTWGTWNAPIPV
ncbi:MAG: acyl-CoA mutase large subunit family protein [Proteobacteria bacterium]|nr:acyl-CoA mutase large subunit family protein [Pseudomonadota bacterium]